MKLKSLTDTFIITKYSPRWRSWRVWQTRSWSPILPPLKKLKSLTDTFLITNTLSIKEVVPPRSSTNTPSIEELKSLTDTFLITNTPSIEEAEEFDRHVLDHQYSLHWRSWRVWQTRSWSPILPPLKKLKSLTDTFLITNTPSIEEAEEFDRHVLDHQYSLHWRNWRVWQTRSWSPILSPIEEAVKFDRHVLDHQYSLPWWSWSVWQTRSWSPILRPLKELKNLTDKFLITNTQSLNEAGEFDRHVRDYQFSLHWRNWRVWQTRSWSPILPPLKKEFDWRVWQTRSWSPILPPLKKLKHLTDTFLITNTPSIEEAEEFDRHILDHQHSLHWWGWRVWQTRSWSPILPPLKELMSLRGTFLITNTPSIGESEEFDRHVLGNQYSVHWRSWRVWQTRSWSPILPPLEELMSLRCTSLITNTPSIYEAEEFDRHVLTPPDEEFDRHVLDHQYPLHWRSWRVWQTRSW